MSVQYPEYKKDEYYDAIESISPHITRHTWAYLTLFEQHLAADFEQSWDDPVWVCGSNGSGWLRGNGKNKIPFLPLRKSLTTYRQC